MRRLSSFVGLFEFHALLFAAALIVFARPVMLMLDDERPTTVVLSFFVPWAFVVILLFCTSRTYGRARGRAADDGNADGHERD